MEGGNHAFLPTTPKTQKNIERMQVFSPPALLRGQWDKGVVTHSAGRCVAPPPPCRTPPQEACERPTRAVSAEPVSPPSACVNAFPVAQERVGGLKLTSFDKLIGKKREGMKRVRIYPETEALSGVDLLFEESSEAL